ncbi:MAG: SWIM zinc finger family protein [Burkholderiales bacterium]|nr:SWIM zinc finger family protein [Burkholderiales bacterium]
MSLATASKWQQCQTNGHMVWGLCQGSGKDPYRTQVDLSEPAFRCSCPSRKFPCKHGLALLVLLARAPQEFTDQVALPDWVQAWVDSRAERAAKQEAKQEAKQQEAKQEAKPATEASTDAPTRRASQRETQVLAGVQDALVWLEDVIRTGLVAARSQAYTYWDTQAARLVDAKAPGIARRVRQLPQLLTSPHWQQEVLAELGNLYLLLQAYTRIEQLAPDVQQDVRSAIGWTIDQAALLQEKGQSDIWHVLAVQQEQEDKLQVRRTWLQGHRSGTLALLLEFSATASRVPLSLPLLVGQSMQAEAVFFPGSVAQRALLKGETSVATQAYAFRPESDGINAALTQVGAQWSANPWLERSGMVLQNVFLVERAQRWQLRDQTGALLPLASRFARQIWPLQALAGGAAVTLFGEWQPDSFWPLSYWQDGQWQALPQEVS